MDGLAVRFNDDPKPFLPPVDPQPTPETSVRLLALYGIHGHRANYIGHFNVAPICSLPSPRTQAFRESSELRGCR